MFTKDMRILNTITEIEISDKYEENWELFNKGISILKKYLNTSDDFNDEDREILEEIFTIMEMS